MEHFQGIRTYFNLSTWKQASATSSVYKVYVDVKELLLLQANTSVQFAIANHRRRFLCKFTMVVQNNFAIFQKFQVCVEQYRQSGAISSTFYGDKQLRIIETRKRL